MFHRFYRNERPVSTKTVDQQQIVNNIPTSQNADTKSFLLKTSKQEAPKPTPQKKSKAVRTVRPRVISTDTSSDDSSDTDT